MNKGIDQWVEEYLKRADHKHKSSRTNDYRKLGRLLADKKLRHFSGRAGARLVQELAANWKASGGLPRSKADQADPNFQGKPLSDQEVRLRLHALMRVLRFAKAEAPEDCSFQVAKLEELFDFKMPAAHGKKRTRQPSDEEFVRLVGHFGLESEMGQLVLLLDESGCRVSEVSTARRKVIECLRGVINAFVPNARLVFILAGRGCLDLDVGFAVALHFCTIQSAVTAIEF